jgi:HK97 gp10 family phage protein
MRRLRKLVPEAEQQVADAQIEVAQELASAIENVAPLGETGDYRASIVGVKLSSRPAGRALVGVGQTKDPNATGIFAEFIWRFLEFGTVKMSARPHIFPTYRANRKRIRRKVAGAVNKAVRKARR